MREKGIPDCTVNQKNQIAQFMLANSTTLVAHHGKIQEAAKVFGVTTRTIHNIWSAAKKQLEQGIPILFKSNRAGLKKKQLLLDAEKIRGIPFTKRSTIRRLGNELSISKSSVGRWVKSGEIRAHTNAIKPELTHVNQLQRLSFSLSSLKVHPSSRKITFSDMFNVVHIDEKWFYMSRESERYYMLPEETEPYRSCKSKRFIPKIMFMCAVSRPTGLTEGGYDFDGKIGLWPFITREPAQRNSKNRDKGTLVTKPIESITKEVIKNCMLTQIIPAIKAKWPANQSKLIYIQQDNAKPHLSNEDPEFRAAASSDGFNIQLICQPPNSPDTNINDLGWFRAIQSLQVDTSSYNIDDLVHNVLLSFENLTAITLNNVFLSLQCCLIEILKVKEHNNYKLPHMGKLRLIREGRLPTSLEVDEALVMDCLQELREAGKEAGLTYDIAGLIRDLGFLQ